MPRSSESEGNSNSILRILGTSGPPIETVTCFRSPMPRWPTSIAGTFTRGPQARNPRIHWFLLAVAATPEGLLDSSCCPLLDPALLAVAAELRSPGKSQPGNLTAISLTMHRLSINRYRRKDEDRAIKPSDRIARHARLGSRSGWKDRKGLETQAVNRACSVFLQGSLSYWSSDMMFSR
jgi:hypothetical protein